MFDLSLSFPSVGVNRTLPHFSQVIKVVYLAISEIKTGELYCVQILPAIASSLFLSFKTVEKHRPGLGTSAPLHLKEAPQLCVETAFA